MTEALRLKPNDGTIVLKSVLVFELMNQRFQALEALQKYIQLHGPLEEVLKDPFLSSLRMDPRYLELVKNRESAGKEQQRKSKTKAGKKLDSELTKKPLSPGK